MDEDQDLDVDADADAVRSAPSFRLSPFALARQEETEEASHPKIINVKRRGGSPAIS